MNTLHRLKYIAQSLKVNVHYHLVVRKCESMLGYFLRREKFEVSVLIYIIDALIDKDSAKFINEPV